MRHYNRVPGRNTSPLITLPVLIAAALASVTRLDETGRTTRRVLAGRAALTPSSVARHG